MAGFVRDQSLRTQLAITDCRVVGCSAEPTTAQSSSSPLEHIGRRQFMSTPTLALVALLDNQA